MRVRSLGACSLLVILAICARAQEEPAPKITVIKAGKVLDPDTGTTASNQLIVIEDKKIKSIGATAEWPNNATLIDLTDMTVLPGLFDCHTHMALITTAKFNYFQESLLRTTAYRAIEGVVNARQMLESGFTTIRDVGNAGNYADTALRQAIEQGLVPGPTIINAGRIIAPYGGQFHTQPEKREALAVPEYFYADSRDEMVKGVRENIHFGAKVIKIVVDDQGYIYSTDDIKFIVEEARAAGFKVAAHAWTHPGAHNAAAAGVASIEHGIGMTDEDLALARKNDVVLVGTDLTREALKEYGREDPEKEHAKWIDRLKRAWKIGTPMAFGTDVTFTPKNGTRGTAAMQFIDSFREAGVPAPAIVRIMTSNAARLLGVDKERGFISPGQFADVIATPGNPADDIQTLKEVRFVMKEGTIVRNDSGAVAR